MNIRNFNFVVIIALFGTNLHAEEKDSQDLFSLFSTGIDDFKVNNDWISANHTENTPVFTLNANNHTGLGNEVGLAWNLSNSIIINLNLFQNQFIPVSAQSNTKRPFNYHKGFTKNSTVYQTSPMNTNRSVSGYNFGISSKFGMGNNSELNIGFNYGLLADANLMGFNTPIVNTSSFALGFRKARFGASLLTDTYLEENVGVIDNTRLGIELDWYFSDDTTISFGSKQRMKNGQSNISSSLDSLTGDVQYIKFQHNL